MAMRRVLEATIGTGKFQDRTFIRLECGHERSLGGHILGGKVLKPSEMLGFNYSCREQMCLNIK